MSLTPIFDATLADAPVNIWQASSVFPIPADISCAAVPSEYFRQPDAGRSPFVAAYAADRIAYAFSRPANINPLLGEAS